MNYAIMKILARLIFLLLNILAASIVMHGQKDNNVWAFGVGAGLDFNTQGNPTPIVTSITQWEGCASLSDGNTGQLLFYTDGNRIWNVNHAVMPNGAINVVTYSTCQAAVIAPIPGSIAQYYVFSLGSSTEGNHADKGKLYYSVVDMSLNGGSGDVLATQKRILLDTGLTEAMASIYYCANNWLLVHTDTGNTFKAYPITATGMGTPVLSAVGMPGTDIRAGIIKVAPDGTKVTFHHQTGGGGSGPTLALFDFDRNTGAVSNPIPLTTHSIYGVAFSPDNSKLYTGSNGSNQIYQYDITSGISATIIASEFIITTGSGRKELQLGPDNKIYIATPGSNALSRIESPNLSGAACNYAPDTIKLAAGTVVQSGLPNILYNNNSKGSSFTTQAFKCATIDAVMATDTSGWDYLWHDNTSGYHHPVSHSGTYWVSYKTSPSSGNCEVVHIDTFKITGIEANISTRYSCKGHNNGKAWIDHSISDTVMYTYAWQSNNDTIVLSTTDSLYNVPAGLYQVHITAPTGCHATLGVIIPEEEYKVYFEPDTIICKGDAVSFRNSSDRHFTTWHWFFGDGETATVQEPYHTYTQSGSYEVMLVGIGTVCTDTAYRTVIVDESHDLTFTTDKDSICAGENITFIPLTHPATTDLHWSMGDGNWFISPVETVKHAYEDVGTMTITLIARFRVCPGISYTDTVWVYPYPLVDLGVDSLLCLRGVPIILSNRVENNPGYYHYRWNTDRDTMPYLKVVHPGRYILSLTNSHGCTTTGEVEVRKDCYIDIPNAFTPNGDGINDYFFPRQLLSNSISFFRFQVFNRWGMMIFESINTEGRGWNGRFNGKEQPAGAYIYLLHVTFDNGRTEEYKGNVTLMR